MSRTLTQWMDYIQTLHSREIDLSLDRVKEVYDRLVPAGVEFTVISVAGTNGKGSTAELLSAICNAAGYKVGKYTSPHLVHFGERYVINGITTNEQQLIETFEKVEYVRGQIPLTFFEFGTLIAIELFNAANVDIAVMEVGLGGRLDAVNILDADVSIITSISFDHTDWLGNTLDEIGCEKAGIARSGRPCIIGLTEPPSAMLAVCSDIGAEVYRIGEKFTYQHEQGTDVWCWQNDHIMLSGLPLPYGQSGAQLNNASSALQVVHLLQEQHPVAKSELVSGLRKAALLARCQQLSKNPLIVLDVAHNESSVSRLVAFLQPMVSRSKSRSGRCYAICGMLKDKEIAKSLSCLTGLIDEWHFVTIANDRGAMATNLRDILCDIVYPDRPAFRCHTSVQEAYKEVFKGLAEDDVLVVFGSFFIAGDILKLLA